MDSWLGTYHMWSLKTNQIIITTDSVVHWSNFAEDLYTLCAQSFDAKPDFNKPASKNDKQQKVNRSERIRIINSSDLSDRSFDNI